MHGKHKKKYFGGMSLDLPGMSMKGKKKKMSGTIY